MNNYYLIIQGMRKIKSNNYSAKKREGKIKINLRILTYNLALLPIAYWAYEQFNGRAFIGFISNLKKIAVHTVLLLCFQHIE